MGKRVVKLSQCESFCVFDENSDFHAKGWGFLKNNYFALSRNVGIPCKILYIFKSAPPFSRAPLHFNETNGFLAKRAVLDQKSTFRPQMRLCGSPAQNPL